MIHILTTASRVLAFLVLLAVSFSLYRDTKPPPRANVQPIVLPLPTKH